MNAYQSRTDLECRLYDAYTDGVSGEDLLEIFDLEFCMLADKMRLIGENHRGVLVGGCALGWISSGENQGEIVPVVLSGANYSPHKGMPRDCAEIEILRKATALGCTSITGLFVSGPDDIETLQSINGRPGAETIEPCDECLTLLYTHPAVNRIMPVSCVSGALREIYSVGRLEEMYKDVTPPLPSRVTVAQGNGLLISAA